MSARKLTDGRMAQLVKNARDPEPTDPKKLNRDEMRLYSFYRPGLAAGTYSVQATQSITSGTQHLDIRNTSADAATANAPKPQEFEVVVPRFALDRELVNSYYPPDGHQDEGRILPHIVLNDPHYPWEIAAGTTKNMHGEIDFDKFHSDQNTSVYRSMVPWIVLLVFDPAELHLSKLGEATALNLPGYTKDDDLRQQNGNGTFSMPVTDYFNRVSESARMNYAAGDAYEEIKWYSDQVDLIFPQKSLIQKMFTDPTTPTTSDHKPGVEQCKYLAHVRHINTEGCPDAGVEQEGLFSVVVAGRTGALLDSVLENNEWKELPTNIKQPRTQVCHLISIEHLDSTLEKWNTESDDTATERVGMVSLFSWVYTALPPDPVNFVTIMRNLTEHQQMLRPDDRLISKLVAMNVKAGASKVLAERMKRGYTLARWRTQMGEETSAFMRGPLVPLQVPHPPALHTMPDCSTNSQDYQILDPQTGLMDLSYSSAWQLGKLLAISDTTFSAALMRFRSVVRNASADKTRMAQNGMAPRSAVLSAINRTMSATRGLTNGSGASTVRLPAPAVRTVVADVTDITSLPVFKDALKDAVGANGGCVAKDGMPVLYNGFNKTPPNNSDWPIIHDWMAEKLSLGGIPPQYIVPEASFVPPESLRFFYIDDFWLDCLLDGALSVANHLDADDDVVRREIKKHFNEYLKTPIPEAGFKPQIPCYGFIIRSKLIKAMPDLKITVTWKNADNRFPVARWTRWDDQTLLCLLDRDPEELDSIELCQPQHQQRFALGSYVNAEKKEVTFTPRQLYTSGPGISKTSGRDMTDVASKWIDFSSRSLLTNKMASEINVQLRAINEHAKPGELTYDDPIPNSCELGLELNDPSYYFTIKPPPGVDPTPHPRERQLYIQTDPPALASPIPKPSILTRKAVHINSITAAQALGKLQEGPQVANVSPPHAQTLTQPFQAPHPQTSALRAATPIVRAAAAGSMQQSNFDLTIFADYRAPPQRRPAVAGIEKYPANDYIPTNNIYYFDLNFALRRRKPSDARLMKIVFDIPIMSDDRKAAEPLLTRNYDGPGVRMLSNQFFVPFLQTDSSKPYLHVVLVPRSADLDYKMSCNDQKTTELAFRLAEANIAPIVGKTWVPMEGSAKMVEVGKCIVTWSEWYSTGAHPEGEPIVRNYAVLKMGVRDDAEEDDIG